MGRSAGKAVQQQLMTFAMSCNPMRLLPIPLLAAVAACAAPQGEFPSLAIRDAERITGTATPAPANPYTPPAPAPATLDRLGQLQAEATAAHAAFTTQAARDRVVIAGLAGAATGSEAWAAGSAALGELEGMRGRTMIALADLDRIHVDAAVAGEDLACIATVRDAVAAMVAQEDAVIAAAIR